MRRRPARRHKKRGGAGKAARRPARRGGRRNLNPQHAIITETWDAGQFASNIATRAALSLQQFPRAQTVAKSFKYYRLKSCEFIYTPDYNTFQESSGGGGVAKPYLYYAMNRTGSAYIPALPDLEQQGAVPIAFTKPVNIRYVPNLVQTLNANASSGGTGLVDQAIGNMPMFHKWLATEFLVTPAPVPQVSPINPISELPLAEYNFPIYYGHNVLVAQTGTSANVGFWSVKCVWEFKEPQPFQTRTG